MIQKRSPPHSNCLSLSPPQWPCSHLQQQDTPTTDRQQRVGSWYWLRYIFLLYLTLCSPLRLHKQNHRQASELARESVVAVHCALQRESASITVLAQQSTFRATFSGSSFGYDWCILLWVKFIVVSRLCESERTTPDDNNVAVCSEFITRGTWPSHDKCIVWPNWAKVMTENPALTPPPSSQGSPRLWFHSLHWKWIRLN